MGEQLNYFSITDGVRMDEKKTGERKRDKKNEDNGKRNREEKREKDQRSLKAKME